MNLLSWRSDFIHFVEKKHVYIVLYVLFVLFFFASPSLRVHCNFFYGLIIPVYLITLRKIKFNYFSSSKIWLMAISLFIYLLLTMLWEKNTGDKGHIYYIRKAVYLFVFFSLTMELTLKYPRFVEKLLFFLTWAGALTAIVSLFYFHHALPFPSARVEYLADLDLETRLVPKYRMAFPVARLKYLADQLRNPVLGGYIYSMVVLIIYFHILKKSSDKSRRWLYGTLIIIISASVLLTLSRGPLVVLMLTFITGGLLTRDKKLLMVLGLVIIIGVVILLKVQPLQKIYTHRGLSYRIELTKKTMALTKDDLLFGKGITTRQTMTAHDGSTLYHPHNAYLGLILYGGFAGLFLFLLLLAMAFREGLRHYLLTKDITLFLWVFFGASTILTSQDKIISHPHPLWFYFWLPVALLAGVSCRESRGYLPPSVGTKRK